MSIRSVVSGVYNKTRKFLSISKFLLHGKYSAARDTAWTQIELPLPLPSVGNMQIVTCESSECRASEVGRNTVDYRGVRKDLFDTQNPGMIPGQSLGIVTTAHTGASLYTAKETSIQGTVVKSIKQRKPRTKYRKPTDNEMYAMANLITFGFSIEQIKNYFDVSPRTVVKAARGTWKNSDSFVSASVYAHASKFVQSLSKSTDTSTSLTCISAIKFLYERNLMHIEYFHEAFDVPEKTVLDVAQNYGYVR